MKKFFDFIKRNAKFISIVTILCILASSITYAFGNKIIKQKNSNLLTYDEYIELKSNKTEKKNEKSGGDVNVDGGGGGNNTQGGAGKPDTILDNEQDEGVRVTLVNAETFERVTTPIDFANNPRKPIELHFGKEYKLWYVKNQKINMLKGDSYTWKTPKTPLPKIVGGDINKIKVYFGDEGFIKYYSSLSGVSFEELTSGKYKFMLEPVGYPKIQGKVTACTATELALLDKKLNGYISKSFIKIFTHRDLPLSMFLAKDEFGLKKFQGSTKAQQSSDTIIKQLGVGAVTFKEQPEEPPEMIIPQYKYRTNTVVYTSITTGLGMGNVISGNGRDGYSVNPVRVNFTLSDTSDGAKIISQKSDAYTSNDTIYVKWRTPEVPKQMFVIANISYVEIEYNEVTGEPIRKNKVEKIEIPIEIEEIIQNPPPNPVADDKNPNWKMPSNIPKISDDKISNSWKEYEVRADSYVVSVDEDGKADIRNVTLTTEKTYTVKFKGSNNLYNDIYTDPYSKTHITRDIGGGRKVYNMKSGYGIRQEINSKLECIVDIREEVIGNYEQEITDDKGNVIGTETKVGVITETRTETHDTSVAPQNAVSYFSDFYFKDYFRLLETSEDVENIGKESILQFKNNRFSTYNNRTHFTPIWYPDDEYYVLNSYIFDAWTPAGMLGIGMNSIKDFGNRDRVTVRDSNNEDDKVTYTTNGIYIKGNLWDDWYVQILPQEYDYYKKPIN